MTLVPVRRLDADVIVAGAGFAGSILALVLRRCGLRVALLERGRHPRFAIGESSTPLAGLLIEELADRYDLPRLRPFAKWGTWRAAHPEIACGLKRGFSFYQHATGTPFVDDDTHARQLLVAASPHDAIADTHWYRPHVDRWLADEAAREGAEYRDALTIDRVDASGTRVSVEGTREGQRLRVEGGFLVDATGPRGLLWRHLALGDAPLEGMPPTQALYAHFHGVGRWADVVPGAGAPPYPVDAAALHHVLPGAWIWVLRFEHGITSAGVAATEPVAQRYGLGEGAPAWSRLLADHPSIAAQFAGAAATMPFVHTPRVAHRTAIVAGRNWALLPSAAGVVDPLLSTGFPLTLLGIGRLAALLSDTQPGSARTAALDRYAADTVAELKATERLVGALYASMDDFALFKRLTLLYFAAASYTETVRRLGQPEGARGFLLHADPAFGPALCDLTARAHGVARLSSPSRWDGMSTLPKGRKGSALPAADERQRLLDDIDRVIEPFDVAGLGNRARKDWYPVDVADLFAAQERLGVSRSDLERMVARTGLLPRGAAAG